jgi:N-acetylglucosamine kinase-like BadF-type ATPase
VTVLGIDIGGSKTHGLLVDDGGTVLAEAFSASANILSVGEAEAARQLDLLIADLLPDGPDGVSAVCVGAAGIEAEADQLRVEALLRERFPGIPLKVVRDVQLVLAAAGRQVGVVAVAGTGAAAWGRDSAGREARAGGWGYLLGDDGAAYGLIRAALRHVLARTDNGEPDDALTRQLLTDAEVDSAHALLGAFYATPERRVWARRAAAVFTLAEAGDDACARLVEAAADDLVAMIEPVCRRLSLPGPVVLAGGMAVHQPLLQRSVRAGLAAAEIYDVQVLDADPVIGAVRLAQQLLLEGQPTS